MMKRRQFIMLLGGAAMAWPLAARAQQGGKLPRLGILSPGRSELPEPGVIMLDAFVQGLHELGYAEGRNLILERRYAEWRPERLRELGTNSSRIPSVWAAARVSCSNVAMVRSL